MSYILSRISHLTPTSITRFAWSLNSYKDIILNKKRILLLDSELWACQNGVIERLNLLSSSFFKCQNYYIIYCIRLLQILSDLHDSFDYLWIDLLISLFIVPNKKIMQSLAFELWTCQNRQIERPNLFGFVLGCQIASVIICIILLQMVFSNLHDFYRREEIERTLSGLSPADR